MIIHIVSLFFPEIFKRYSEKYKIFRELYENDLIGLEIRNIEYKIAKKTKRIVLSNKEICFITEKNETNNCDLLILGNYLIFKELANEITSLGNEELGFKINRVIQNLYSYDKKSFIINEIEFPLIKSYTFGILNVTPDSFSDGGKYYSKAKAIEHGIYLLENGADILDIGGESTRPGSESVSVDEEINRVIPVIQKIIELKPDALISIDTTKYDVAKLAVENGAKIINDISGLSFDPKMKELVKENNLPCVIMHIKGKPKTMQDNPFYKDVIADIYDDLYLKVNELKKNGINNVIIDPGIGFGKRVKDNYEILKRLNEFNGVGQPILIGVSKKSFLGKSLNLSIDNREIPSIIAETIAIKNGARFIRTHEPQNAKFSSIVNYYIDYNEKLND